MSSNMGWSASAWSDHAQRTEHRNLLTQHSSNGEGCQDLSVHTHEQQCLHGLQKQVGLIITHSK